MKRTKREKRKKLRYYFSLLLIMLSGGAALFIGTAIVSVNCHNTVSSSKIVLFDIEKDSGETVITFMGKEYIL